MSEVSICENVIVLGDSPHVCEQGLHSPYVAQARGVAETVLSVCQIRVAAIRGKAQFLAPLIRTSPLRGTPPSITSLSIKLLPLAADVQDPFYA